MTAKPNNGMRESMTDGDTDTFWEGDGNGGTVTFEFPDEVYVEAMTVAVAAGDKAAIPSGMSLAYGVHPDYLDGEVASVSVDRKSLYTEDGNIGWFTYPVGVASRTFVLRVSGQTPRVRQLRVLARAVKARVPGKAGPSFAHAALGVFNRLAAQVFGTLQAGGDGASADLREQLVSMLEDASPLKATVLDVLRAELVRVTEARLGLAWQPSQRKTAASRVAFELAVADDTFPFELISMVHALSASKAGLAWVLSGEGMPVVWAAGALLLTGTTRVQRGALGVLKRVFSSDVDFGTMGRALGVLVGGTTLAEYFAAVVAKTLRATLRVAGKKAKSEEKGAAEREFDEVFGELPAYRGQVPDELRAGVVELARMAIAGGENEGEHEGATVVRSRLVAQVSNLVQMQELDASEMFTSEALWLSVAALGVLCEDETAVAAVNEAASAALARESDDGNDGAAEVVLCENHDDGVTKAAMRCESCATALCADCDRFLHLPRNKREHTREAIIDHEAFVVEMREGCARVKMSQFVVVFDVEKGKVLLRVEARSSSGRACRFCGSELSVENEVLVAKVRDVCNDAECMERSEQVCVDVLECGHPCGGVRGEKEHLPCLVAGCDEAMTVAKDDMCMICWTEPLEAAPAVKLGCGHVFHAMCVDRLLKAKWSGPRINFGFWACPLCKDARFEHPALEEAIAPLRELEEKVKSKAKLRARASGLAEDAAVMAEYGDDVVAAAMARFAYYQCYECKEPYYGGAVACEAAGRGGDFDETELVCGGCVGRRIGATACSKHGMGDNMVFACRYCCSVAVWFCFGTTHFCDTCHSNVGGVQAAAASEDRPVCPVGPGCKQLPPGPCPLGLKECPPVGEELCLGCGLCAEAQEY
ncbi:uncharacterized protein AMSG_12273 [Thecamonas trahens ATCC 50062]|uniref:RCR-type E3 ubiquitin transferase n=1 Tax=Thecamonas trahens ATCC 50062 TaxID=461836 RepID=A0A0L0DQV5_THETB|nr:hypothetical protein AMSG_12273 [Thecamonas trahens ATCC 50062]KNC53818.1 hypothetical protein AMSG_12273 [Thecamonas trahens ATCC 50062]|eukprot:XP_013754386.1 hypothetical protein AMSG_12273 [Thecamonas trahens ATCC 50062]